MISEKIDGNNEIYTCMMSGVVVTYAMNFNSANGLGSLPNSYGKFSNKNLYTAHSKLLNSRNTVYAHRDKKSHTFIDEEGEAHNYPVSVHLDLETEQFLFSAHLVDISSSRISDIITLITFQLERLQKDLDSKVVNIVDDISKYKFDTKYYLGVDFP